MTLCPHPKQGRSPCQPWLTWKWWAGPGRLRRAELHKVAADPCGDTGVFTRYNRPEGAVSSLKGELVQQSFISLLTNNSSAGPDRAGSGAPRTERQTG